MTPVLFEHAQRVFRMTPHGRKEKVEMLLCWIKGEKRFRIAVGCFAGMLERPQNIYTVFPP